MSSAASLSVAKDAWLSGVMARDVHRIAGIVATGGETAAEQTVRGVTQSPGFCYARVPTHELRTSELLERCGFRLVDTGLTLEATAVAGGEAGARFAHPQDRAAAEEIARSSFVYSRFHLDPHVPRELADDIKARWAGNFFSGQRGDYMVVAEHVGEVAGFLQLLKTQDQVLVVDLIAVATAHRGRGLAAGMIAFAARNCGVVRMLRVGTQIANTASLGLYQKIGFRIVASAYMFHHHQGVKGTS